VYRGLIDSEGNSWKYYKLSVQSGQTLKVEFRLRDSGWSILEVKLHGPTGASVAYTNGLGASAGGTVEHKAQLSDFLYISIKGPVRDSAFDISLR
jgi:hypothetical protein